MASMTTQPPPAKRQRGLKESTILALKQPRAREIEIGILVLPAGIESTCGIMSKILQYLDIRSLLNVKESSLIQQCRKAFESNDFERIRDEALSLDYEGVRGINEMIQTHPARRLYLLIERYQEEFPHGTSHYGRNAIPTPFHKPGANFLATANAPVMRGANLIATIAPKNVKNTPLAPNISTSF